MLCMDICDFLCEMILGLCYIIFIIRREGVTLCQKKKAILYVQIVT